MFMVSASMIKVVAPFLGRRLYHHRALQGVGRAKAPG
jgi:hypothetical protein